MDNRGLRPITIALAVLASLLAGAARPATQSAISYRFTFPEPQHHWMQVEIAFTGLPDRALELRMSRSSPGRYSQHDFAKNVYDVRAAGAGERALRISRSDPHGWVVHDHGGDATVRYRVFGDRLDGTYLAIDPTHAHINMPAAVMWAKGLDDRPITVRVEPPDGRNWRAATQLLPGPSDREFVAPNLQYLMDSPMELSPFVLRELVVDGQLIRLVVHHSGTAGEVDDFARGVERVVREQRDIFGEFPDYEPGHYTFLADYLPYAAGDAMEHRNSTVLTSPATLATAREALLGGVAHEFFHGWNVERIRPRSLEPFDFDGPNLSGELWLAEGFTEYFGPLSMVRAGVLDFDGFAAAMRELIASVAANPARLVRSAEAMSHMASFTDLGRPLDRTNWRQTFISYYDFGGAIALALDLTLRSRTGGKVSLDDYMRAMWRVHGKPGGARPGYVDRPYTMADAEARLVEVSGDAAFARDFFARFIQGHEVADYAALLQQAGLVLRKAAPGRAWLGDVDLVTRAGAVRVESPPPFGSPIYAAELDTDDEIRELDGVAIRSASDVASVLARRRPGDRVSIAFVDRSGRQRTSAMTLAEDPALELVPIERSGRAATAAQRAFRERWVN